MKNGAAYKICCIFPDIVPGFSQWILVEKLKIGQHSIQSILAKFKWHDKSESVNKVNKVI